MYGGFTFYQNVATFHKETKVVKVFNLQASLWALYNPACFTPDPSGRVHNVSGEFYKLCMREEQYGVWKCTCSGRWEVVCEFPDNGDNRTYLRKTIYSNLLRTALYMSVLREQQVSEMNASFYKRCMYLQISTCELRI
jgi:hypothetical protein